MSSDSPTLKWSEGEPPALVRTGDQLDVLLDQITAKCRPDSPIAVVLQARGFDAHFLIGLQESFVYLDDVPSSRYFVTLGNLHLDGVVGFHLFGQHHTEFDRRYLIPAAAARCALREFFDTGCRCADVKWREGQY